MTRTRNESFDSARKGIADECNLVAIDAAVLERQGASGVDPQNGEARKLNKRAEIVVDEAAIAGERRQEAPENVIERHIMVTRNAEHLVARILKPLEELARLLELVGPCALSKVAADHDKVGVELVNAAFDGAHEVLIVGAKMQIGKVHEAGHASFNHVMQNLFQHPSR